MTARSFRATIAGFAACICAGGAAADAAAAQTLIATRATADPDSGRYVAYVGGIDENGRPLKVAEVEVIPSKQRMEIGTLHQPLSDWAVVASEQSTTWRPPLVIGLVYLWVTGVPAGVLDGIHSFFQRVPSRTTVLPTVYGRMRQGRASLIAADIGRLDDEVPPLENYRPNLLEAIRLDLGDLATHPGPIKVLLVVTDGRDFADPKGRGPGDFATFGREIRKAGVTPLIVGYPPEADALQSATNLRELHESAGGFLRLLDRPEDLENTLESLGQAVGDLTRVEFEVPWSWRALGASHRISYRLTTASGSRLTVDAGSLEVKAGRSLRLAVAGTAIFGAAVLLGLLLIRLRSRKPLESGEDDALVAAAHALIRRGAAPARAVDELSRAFPGSVGNLVNLDREVLNDSRFPFFQSRLGRKRMQEMQDLLSSRSESRSGLSPVALEVISDAISKQAAPSSAAETLAARLPAEDCMAFASMSVERVAEELRAAAPDHGVLGTPRARVLAVAIQKALRARDGGGPGIVVGWLVRAGGPGRRGETVRLGLGRTLLGSSNACQLRIGGDPAVEAEHAEIRLDGDGFVVAPAQGRISVEGENIGGPHRLSDGETIQIGSSLFVFKAAATGGLVTGTTRDA